MYKVIPLDEAKVQALFFHGSPWWSKSTKKFDITEYKTAHPKAILIATISKFFSTKCPVCKNPLPKLDIDKRRCMSCHQYLIFRGESIKDIVNVRNDIMIYTHDIDSSTGGAVQPIHFKYLESVFESNLRPGDRLVVKY